MRKIWYTYMQHLSNATHAQVRRIWYIIASVKHNTPAQQWRVRKLTPLCHAMPLNKNVHIVNLTWRSVRWWICLWTYHQMTSGNKKNSCTHAKKSETKLITSVLKRKKKREIKTQTHRLLILLSVCRLNSGSTLKICMLLHSPIPL